MSWTLWRQDDHGHRFAVASFATEAAAVAARRDYEARGHKQVYWVAEGLDQAGFEAFVAGLPAVERETFGAYALFFVGEARTVPFVSFVDADQEGDRGSRLDREGVFRINVALSKEAYAELLGGAGARGGEAARGDQGAPGDEAGRGDEAARGDCDALDTWLPHPHYAAQHYACILNPQGENVGRAKRLIADAHAAATRRLERLA